jgi:hypothetical protein
MAARAKTRRDENIVVFLCGSRKSGQEKECGGAGSDGLQWAAKDGREKNKGHACTL